MEQKIDVENSQETKKYWIRVIKKLLSVVLVLVGLFLALKCAIFLLPFVIAIIINKLMSPLVKLMTNKLKFNHKVSVIISVILVIAILGTIITFAGVKLTEEVYDLTVNIPTYINAIMPTINGIMQQIEIAFVDLPEAITSQYYAAVSDIGKLLIDKAGQIGNGIIDSVMGLPTLVVYIFITILATLFIGFDKTYIKEEFVHQIPDKWAKTIEDVYKNIFSAIGAYIKSVATIVLITFCELLVGLTIIDLIGFDLPYVLALAVGIAIVDALPILGCGTVLIPWAIISALTGNFSFAVAIFILYIVITVVRQLIEPKIVSHNIGVHPIITLLAMFIGFKFFGVIGLIFGPITIFILKGIFAKQLEKGFFRDIFQK